MLWEYQGAVNTIQAVGVRGLGNTVNPVGVLWCRNTVHDVYRPRMFLGSVNSVHAAMWEYLGAVLRLC